MVGVSVMTRSSAPSAGRADFECRVAARPNEDTRVLERAGSRVWHPAPRQGPVPSVALPGDLAVTVNWRSPAALPRVRRRRHPAPRLHHARRPRRRPPAARCWSASTPCTPTADGPRVLVGWRQTGHRHRPRPELDDRAADGPCWSAASGGSSSPRPSRPPPPPRDPDMASSVTRRGHAAGPPPAGSATSSRCRAAPLGTRRAGPEGRPLQHRPVLTDQHQT